jgi:glycerol-3-phosphate acyltransferase PlsX
MIRIAIDSMSGDFGPAVTVPASVRALSFLPDLNLVLLGDADAIGTQLDRLNSPHANRIQVLATSQVVAMDEKPSSALRNKKDSSLYRAIQLLKDGEVQACVSAGNTGALLAVGCHVLRTFDGIDRPAICATIPTQNGRAFMLDVGANVDVHAENLHQFAVMGSVLAAAILNKENPRVSLLNIGVEDIKGNEQVKHAVSLLQADSALNYTGFIEAHEIFFDKADVVVCDGFVGNVALKAGEGAARLIGHKLKQSFRGGLFRRVVGMLLRPMLADFRAEINPARYNGASFLGLTATLVKSHGSADVEAFCRAIELTADEVRAEIPQRIQQQLEQ